MSDTQPDPIIVDILPAQVDGGEWNPQPGPETMSLSLPTDGRTTIIDEARRVLVRCVPPNSSVSSQTGLVVGYVQSGKTMSFTTLAALARDNGYQMVIIIAGTSTSLFRQSRQRLVRDLRLEDRNGFNPWRHISQPRVADHSQIAIEDTLAEWNDPSVPEGERRTILITVMKHHGRLQHLIDVLQHVDLTHTPTIIIDDEGDQAGLNTQVTQGSQSTTYARILAMKDVIPQHSYLQYTATPQGPLLINIVDLLSPAFAEVLTPGQGYVGGADFFQIHPNLVRQIPAVQIPQQNMPVHAPPPETLLEAMRLFFVGVAVGQILDHSAGHRSMMVHPSQRTDPHNRFHNWVSAARQNWLATLELPDGDPDRRDLLDLFRRAYDDLANTTATIPPWNDIVVRLPHAIRRTSVREVNATGGTTTQINWSETYAWILVGGQAMDRGFTVEGLTVTYMPRGMGVGNADTVQQRARFFGYKRFYLGLCRVFLGQDVQRAFQAYVEHEEDIRRELLDFRATGRPLSEWRRQFFLDTVMRPTRDNIIDIAYQRYRMGSDWVYPNGAHESGGAVAENRLLFQAFVATHPFLQDTTPDLRRNSPRNRVLPDVLLRDVHEELLTRYRVSRVEDSQYFGSMLRLIQLHLMENPNATCSVYLMGDGQARRRSYADGKINQLFQGVQYATQNGQRIVTYPGDRQIKAPHGVSIQLSYLDLGPATGALIASNVPHVAVWIPPELGRETVDQPQGGPHAP